MNGMEYVSEVAVKKTLVLFSLFEVVNGTNSTWSPILRAEVRVLTSYVVRTFSVGSLLFQMMLSFARF